MEIMRRYEGRLARLETFVRERQRWLEEQRTHPERVKKWLAWLSVDAARHPPERDSCRPEPSGEGPNASTGPLVEPLGPSLRSGRQWVAPTPPPSPEPYLSPPPPPRPAIEFIERGGGMSIAIDTATGQMASSAQVLAALLSKRPPGE